MSVPPGAHAAVPPPDSGWNLVWSDDFGGAPGAGLSADWIYDTGTSHPGGAQNWGTGEVETMTSSTDNVYQDGASHLVIKALRDAAGNWTSGRVVTMRTDFQPPSGGVLRVQASIQPPQVGSAAAKGYWPAFWMLGAPFRGNYQNWPIVGEIDIMENLNGSNTALGTLHCGTNPGGPCNETTGISANTSCPGSGCSGGFHTYAIEWDRSASPETIRWYLDGVQYHSVDASTSNIDPATWAETTNHGYFIILNLAMGGLLPGNPTPDTASGEPMFIDYVAVYQRG